MTEHDKQMIWDNFTAQDGYQLCSSKRFHQAMKRIFKI